MSAIMTLEKGDLILTGTPKGVGQVKPGDKVEAQLLVDGKVIEEIKFDAEENQVLTNINRYRHYINIPSFGGWNCLNIILASLITLWLCKSME